MPILELSHQERLTKDFMCATQAPVLVSNLLHAMNKKELTAKYDGYASCPILVSNLFMAVRTVSGGRLVSNLWWEQAYLLPIISFSPQKYTRDEETLFLHTPRAADI